MSAHLCWIAWNEPIGRPNCTRLFAYATARSRQRCAPPTCSAASAMAARSRIRSSAAAARAFLAEPRRGGHAHALQLDLGEPPGLIERRKRAPLHALRVGGHREEREAFLSAAPLARAPPPPAAPRSGRPARSACGPRAGSPRPAGARWSRSRRHPSSCRARRRPASPACGPPRSPGAARAAARRCRPPAARSRPGRRVEKKGAQSSASPIVSSSAVSSTAPRPSPPYVLGDAHGRPAQLGGDLLPQLGREAELALHRASHLLRGGVLRQEGARGLAQRLLLLGEGEAHAGQVP